MRKIYYTFQLLICLIISPVSLAVDGVLEINHTCATQLGCFSGDTVGYPVTIDGTAGGSYRLTSDLIMDFNSSPPNSIEISSSNIQLDLNGFSIISGFCVGNTNNCTSPLINSRDAIGIISSNSGITIKNGKIIGMANHGILLSGSNNKIENILAKWNLGIGISIGSHGQILSSSTIENDSTGLSCGANSRIYGNISSGNMVDGISTGSNSSVINNIVTSNTNKGLNMSGSVAYKDNVMNSNTGGDVNGGVDTGGNLCGATICP